MSKEIILECPVCGKKFIKERNAQKYCSAKCRRKANAKKPTIKVKKYKCEYCGKEFLSDRKKKYCSDRCREKANGRHRKEKKKVTKPKMSIDEVAKRCREENISYGRFVAKYGL